VTEQPTSYAQADAAHSDEGRHHHSLWTLTSILLLLVISALALLMFRGTDPGSLAFGDRGDKSILAVDDADAAPSLVSVWVDGSTSIEDTLDSAGITADSISDMGDGRYLITIAAGLEDSCAECLAKQDGVYDVGRVFEASAVR